MNLTAGQKRAVHAAARQATYDENAYRLVLKNLAGVSSSSDQRITRVGYISVMAFFEHEAGGTLCGCDEGYWQKEMAAARPTDTLLFAIRREAKGLGWDEARLNTFLAGPHMSSGRYLTLDEAPAPWLARVLNALKAMAGRQGAAERTGEPF